MALLENVDPTGLEEFSVVFTDRSLNSMSQSFQTVMTDISSMLKDVYRAEAVVLIPGGGSYGMEAVARQFARGADVLVVRNGWFSYRWSQIIETGGLTRSCTVMKARQTGNDTRAPFAPAPIDEVVAAIVEDVLPNKTLETLLAPNYSGRAQMARMASLFPDLGMKLGTLIRKQARKSFREKFGARK